MFTVHQIIICERGESVSEAVKDWRITVTLTKEQEEAIVKMRQTDKYARCSFGEIVRQLINIGLEVKSNDA